MTVNKLKRLENEINEGEWKPKNDEGVSSEIIEETMLMSTESDERLYFAYGSNMDEEQMADRCPEARLIEKARLNGYQFIINTRGVASIVKQAESFVDGILWEISSRDEVALDRYEGVSSNIYFKKEITVDSMQSEEKYIALVYIASDNAPGQPRQGYIERIIKAAGKFKFDSNYLMELEGWLR